MDVHAAERGTITELFGGVGRGDELAAIKLWQWVEKVARGHYNGLADALDLDAAISDAYARLLHLAPLGRLDRIANREQLRRFLRWVVYCNLLNQLRREASRAGRRSDGSIDPDDMPDGGPAPDSAAMIRDELRCIFTELRRHDPVLAEITRLRLDGIDDAGIAAALKVCVRTVQRKLDLIEGFIEQKFKGKRPHGDDKEAA